MKRKKLPPAFNRAVLRKFYSGKDVNFKYGANKVKINKNTLTAQKILEENFGNLKKGLEAIEKMKLEDAASKALQEIRRQTQSLQLKLQQEEIKQAVTNPLTGAVRKQRFKTPAITNKLADLITGKDDSYKKLEKTEILPDGRKRHHIMYKPKHEPDEYFIMDFMWDNNIHDIFGLVRFYKKNPKIRYEPKSWDDLCNVLRSLNFSPTEVLNYSISKIQTKERFLDHRLYRRIKRSETYALTTFINIYKKHLKSKLPFKMFYHSKDLANWCVEEDIYFDSEENCRNNKTLLVEAWNKLHPKDKVIDTKKKKQKKTKKK